MINHKETEQSERVREILNTVRQLEVRTRHLVDETLAGKYHSVFKGRGMDFDAVRPYAVGDDIRSIDWNVTARTGDPFIKRFREERELQIMLAIDISGSGEFGSTGPSKREHAAELGAILAFSAIKNNDKVGLVLFSDEVELYIPAKKGRRHILRLVREILFFEAKRRGTNFIAPLDFLNNILHKRSITFLISDFCMSGDFSNTLEQLKPKLRASKRRQDLVAVWVNDPRDSELPNIGLLTLEDAETGEQVEINTSDSHVREAYQKLSSKRREQLRQTLLRTGTDVMEISTSRPCLPELMEFFRRREQRRSRS
jgi:uncharacterized protein (DUF58 family)